MCGRFVLTTPADALAREFAALDPGLALGARYNVAPLQNVVIVREADGKRSLAMVRWGLLPAWTKDPALASRLINARSETVAEKPSFRQAVKTRRCLVPACGFYEWKREGRRRQPWYFTSTRPRTLAIAGLWERWRSPEGEIVETCCLITAPANALVAPVHDRMPVLLDESGCARWLDAGITDAAPLQSLLVPAPEESLRAWPVSPAVGDARHDHSTNIEPIDEDRPSTLFPE